jgi:hypothetical protein
MMKAERGLAQTRFLVRQFDKDVAVVEQADHLNKNRLSRMLSDQWPMVLSTPPLARMGNTQ